MRINAIYRQDTIVQIAMGKTVGSLDQPEGLVTFSCGNRQEAIVLEGTLRTVFDLLKDTEGSLHIRQVDISKF